MREGIIIKRCKSEISYWLHPCNKQRFQRRSISKQPLLPLSHHVIDNGESQNHLYDTH